MTWPNLVWADLQHRFPGLDIDYINGGVPGSLDGDLKEKS